MTRSRWVPFVVVILAVSAIAFHPSLGSSDSSDTTPPTFEIQAIYDQPLWDYVLIRVRASEPVKDMAVTVEVSTQGSKSVSEPVSMTAILGATVFEGRFTPQKGWGNIGSIVVTASDLAGNTETSAGTFEKVSMTIQDAKTEGERQKLVEELNQLNRLTRGPMTLKEIIQFPEPVEIVRLASDGSLRAVATQSRLKFYDSRGKVTKEIELGKHFRVSASERGEQYAVVNYPYLDVSSEAPLGPAPLTLYGANGDVVGTMNIDGNTLVVPSDAAGKVVLRGLGSSLYFIDIISKRIVKKKYIPSLGEQDHGADQFVRISAEGQKVAVMANYPPEEPIPSKSEVFLCDIDGNEIWRKTIAKASVMEQLWISRTGKYVNMWSMLLGSAGEEIADYKTRGSCVFSEDEGLMVLTSRGGSLGFAETATGSILRTVKVKQSPTKQDTFAVQLSGNKILTGFYSRLQIPGRFPGAFDPQVHLLGLTGDRLGIYLVPFLGFGVKKQTAISPKSLSLSLGSQTYLFTIQ